MSSSMRRAWLALAALVTCQGILACESGGLLVVEYKDAGNDACAGGGGTGGTEPDAGEPCAGAGGTD